MLRVQFHKYGSRLLIVIICLLSLAVSLSITLGIMILLDLPYIKEGIIIATICSISIPVPITHYVFKLLNELDKRELELDSKNSELEKVLSEVRTLQGLIPVCSHCKKIRYDDGYWGTLKSYIKKHSDAMIIHGICPACKEVIPKK
ncbi:MAG: hypothetical protein ABW166_16160 [Sedimenticola sp.]